MKKSIIKLRGALVFNLNYYLIPNYNLNLQYHRDIDNPQYSILISINFKK